MLRRRMKGHKRTFGAIAKLSGVEVGGGAAES